jgi:uncharacterized SAM-binding protein YcdF (DUF218 family)
MKIGRVLFCLVTIATLAAVVWFAFPTRILREKLATALVLPTGLVWLLLGLICVLAFGAKQKWLSIVALTVWVLMTVAGNMYVARMALVSLEREFLECRPLEEAPMSTVVVLGGGLAPNVRGDAQAIGGGDRVVLAAELYHAGLTEHIICTGSYIEGMDVGGARSQGVLATQLLERLGVPADRIRTVGGRTTTEEMAALAELLQAEQELGLITSASHMRRALRLSRAAGLEFKPLPADFAARSDMKPLAIDVVPSSWALGMSDRAVKEYLARLVGR